MPGLRSIGDIVAADYAGRCHIAQFRKVVASAATPTSGWVDYSYFAGLPTANFYASSPLVAAVLEASKGIYVPQVSPLKQFIKALTVMSGAASATTTTSQRQRLMLCDYLMYYPFIDTDAIGEEQTLENPITLPRYSSGQVMVVSQSAASTVGTFTFTYTNQDGASGRVSQPHYTLSSLAGGGQVAATAASGAGFHPFLALQNGDTGVSSIQSVTFTAAGGGLMALVIVKPLLDHVVAQECRRTTSSNLESYGSASEFLSVIHGQKLPEVKDGAILNIMAQGFAGSLASSQLVGLLETVWA